MEPIKRDSEVGLLLYDPYPYWSSPRSTLLSRIYGMFSSRYWPMIASFDQVKQESCAMYTLPSANFRPSGALTSKLGRRRQRHMHRNCAPSVGGPGNSVSHL